MTSIFNILKFWGLYTTDPRFDVSSIDWIIGLFLRQLYQKTRIKTTLQCIPYILPMTKDCLICKELCKYDLKYKQSFNDFWIRFFENKK